MNIVEVTYRWAKPLDRLKALVAAGKLTPEEYLEVTGERSAALSADLSASRN